MTSQELAIERAKDRIEEIRSVLKIAFFKIAYPINIFFLIADWTLFREKFHYFLLNRSSVFLIGSLCIYLSRRVRTERGVQMVCLLGVILVALEVDGALWIARSTVYYNYVALLLVTMASSFFVPFSLRYWIYSLIGTYVPYLIGWLFIFWDPADSGILFSAFMNIVSTIVISYFMNRFHEQLRNRELVSRLALRNEVQRRDEIIAEKTREAVELEFKVRETKILADIAKHVSHDIRSPISAMNLVVGSLKDLPDAKKNLLNEAIKRVNDIANDLLKRSSEQPTFSAAPTTKTQMHEIRFLVDEVLVEKRVQYQDEDIEFSVMTEPQKGIVLVGIDHVKFKRIISNLINNSIEAISRDGAIDISVSQSTSHVLITVRDNGCGIPHDLISKVMVEGFTHGKIGGNGLGLSTARREIESWGGSLEITSAPGTGTTVTIRLPLQT